MATEYISREAAINACKSATDLYEPISHDIAIECAVAKIKQVPSADVVAVVRCRDCVHYIGYRQDCGLYAWGKSSGLENPSPDDFCSRGERRP